MDAEDDGRVEVMATEPDGSLSVIAKLSFFAIGAAGGIELLRVISWAIGPWLGSHANRP